MKLKQFKAIIKDSSKKTLPVQKNFNQKSIKKIHLLIRNNKKL